MPFAYIDQILTRRLCGGILIVIYRNAESAEEFPVTPGNIKGLFFLYVTYGDERDDLYGPLARLAAGVPGPVNLLDRLRRNIHCSRKHILRLPYPGIDGTVVVGV